ncbi:MAG TPA: YceK/YidQ family lipoprotein, partial [Leptospiraceae bacterium]|nr:YceK/YidQ family lipoprotein [Leptospiraceae bacterium]
MKKLLIVTIFIIAFTHNCMTFFTSYNWKKEPSSRIYSGTAANVQLIFNGPIQGQWSVLFPMALIDFPFSFTADTVLLPYHGFYAILYGLAEISKEDSNTPKRNEYEKKYPAYSKFEKAIKDNNLELWNDKEELKKDEELIFDNSAYEMLHRSNVSWPCFSVDWLIPEYFIPQTFKNFYSPLENRMYKDEFPYTCYFIAGAQTSEKNG